MSDEVTSQDLKDGLAQLGLKRGTVLEVHSSLGSFGRVVGGADTVIDALKHMLGPSGTIIMSVYPLSKPVPLAPGDAELGIAWKVRRLPRDVPGITSGMGMIADRFRDRDDVVLGQQEIHRIAAWGNRADHFVEGYHRVLEANGLVLLLGVDMDRCSSLHQAERRVSLPTILEQQMQPPGEVQRAAEAVYPNNDWILGYAVPFVNFNKVREVAEERYLIRQIRIGKAPVRLFRAKALVDLYEELRRYHPHRLIDRQFVVSEH